MCLIYTDLCITWPVVGNGVMHTCWRRNHLIRWNCIGAFWIINSMWCSGVKFQPSMHYHLPLRASHLLCSKSCSSHIYIYIYIYNTDWLDYHWIKDRQLSLYYWSHSRCLLYSMLCEDSSDDCPWWRLWDSVRLLLQSSSPFSISNWLSS